MLVSLSVQVTCKYYFGLNHFLQEEYVEVRSRYCACLLVRIDPVIRRLIVNSLLHLRIAIATPLETKSTCRILVLYLYFIL
jgi:hypothetical protein